MSEEEVSEIMNNEGPVEEESTSEVVVEEVPEEEPEEEAPAEEAPAEEEESVEAPVEAEEEDEEAVEEPAEEAPAEEAPTEEADEPASASETEAVEPASASETEAVEPASASETEAVEPEVAPIEQVVSDIRDILSEEPVAAASASEADAVSTDNLCSLKTLVNVLGQWSGKNLRSSKVEAELIKDNMVDDNLDNIEKVVEIFKIWIKETEAEDNFATWGVKMWIKKNYFININEFDLENESKNLSEGIKKGILKILIKLTINISKKKVSIDEATKILDNIY